MPFYMRFTSHGAPEPQSASKIQNFSELQWDSIGFLIVTILVIQLDLVENHQSDGSQSSDGVVRPPAALFLVELKW